MIDLDIPVASLTDLNNLCTTLVNLSKVDEEKSSECFHNHDYATSNLYAHSRDAYIRASNEVSALMSSVRDNVSWSLPQEPEDVEFIISSENDRIFRRVEGGYLAWSPDNYTFFTTLFGWAQVLNSNSSLRPATEEELLKYGVVSGEVSVSRSDLKRIIELAEANAIFSDQFSSISKLKSQMEESDSES